MPESFKLKLVPSKIRTRVRKLASIFSLSGADIADNCWKHIRSCMKRELNSNLSGNKAYCTDSLISLAKNMLRSKFRRKKGINIMIFLFKTIWKTFTWNMNQAKARIWPWLPYWVPNVLLLLSSSLLSGLKSSDTNSMRLKYEPALESQHISVKELFPN